MLFMCALSFVLTGSAVMAMFGLAWHRPALLCPIILSSAIVSAFHGVSMARWLRDWYHHIFGGYFGFGAKFGPERTSELLVSPEFGHPSPREFFYSQPAFLAI